MPESDRDVANHPRHAADRDRQLVAAGEPPWGDVEPGTTSVTYWIARPSPSEEILFRIVAEVEGGPFYFESYADRQWKLDGRGLTFVGHAPGKEMNYARVTGHQAFAIMRKQDAG